MGRLEAHIDAQNLNLILTHKIVSGLSLDGLVSISLRDFWTSLLGSCDQGMLTYGNPCDCRGAN